MDGACCVILHTRVRRIAEFHTELELIPSEMHDNLYIKHPIQLEQVPPRLI